jgi:hypothetical protein
VSAEQFIKEIHAPMTIREAWEQLLTAERLVFRRRDPVGTWEPHRKEAFAD